MTEFLHKDPEKALNQVKERLYDRMKVLSYCTKDASKDEYGYIEEYDRAMANELEFLQNLLDMIERW